MMRLRRIAMFYLALLPTSAFAEVQDLAMGSSVERHLPGDEQFMQWTRDAERLATQQGDEMATREVVVPTPETIKLQNVVPPIHFDSGVAEVPDSTIANLRAALESVRDKQNVRLHLVGHADNQPLSARLARVYTDNEGLSRERAGQVAELFQKTLGLSAESMSFEWAGDSQADCRQRDGSGSRAEPARRGGGLVRRDEGHDGDRRGTRQERHPAGEGLPRRDRVQDALPRRTSAPCARSQSRGAAALRRSIGRPDAGIRRAGSAHAGAPRRQAARRRQIHRLHRQHRTRIARRTHLRRSADAVEGACAPRCARDSGTTAGCRPNRWKARVTAPSARSHPTRRSRGGR